MRRFLVEFMNFLARYFRFEEMGTTWRAEVTGGVTTFVTVAYIVEVNPGILSEALGQDLFAELLFATCVSVAVSTLIMGIAANYPFALAPGMGLNAFFAYTVVLGMGVHRDLAFAVVLGSGLVFLLLTFLRIREAIITAVPETLKRATAAGIGMFIAFIGLKNAGLVEGDPVMFVTLGEVRTGPSGLAILGLVATGVMLVRGMRGGILFGVIGVTVLSVLTGVTQPPQGVLSLPAWPERIFGVAVLNLPTAFSVGLIELVFAFLFVDLFDTMGTLVGLSERVGYLDVSGYYDAAMIDLGMPGLSGDQVAQEIRRRDPPLATVLITGWELEKDDHRFLAFDFRLQKPFDNLASVLNVVAQAIELHDTRLKAG